MNFMKLFFGIKPIETIVTKPYGLPPEEEAERLKILIEIFEKLGPNDPFLL